LKVCI